MPLMPVIQMDAESKPNQKSVGLEQVVPVTPTGGGFVLWFAHGAMGGGGDNSMISTVKIRCAIVAAVALAFAATPPNTHAQVAEAPATEEAATRAEVKETVAMPTLDAAVEMEIRRQNDELRNELRRQYLDDRAESITWWLAIIAIIITAFGIAIPIAFAFGLRKFRHIESEAHEAVKKAQEGADKASQVADEAIKYIKEIEKHKQQAEESVQTILEKVNEDMAISAKVEQPEETLEDIQQSPENSMLKKEIARANSLQTSGEIEKAIEKWRAIANLAEGIDKKISARAWCKIGFLVDELKDKIAAYSKAIHFDHQNAFAYNNRGIVKARLERYHSAIEDYDEAIRLDSEYSTAYKFRGSAKAKLKEYEDSIKDYDKAINLDPKYTWAYISRGYAKLISRGNEASRSDFKTALMLAKESGNKKLAIRISKVIQRLNDSEAKKQD